MASNSDNSAGAPPSDTSPATDILWITIGTILGVVLLGAVFGAAWPPGVGLVALAALVALFVILMRGAAAMNEPGTFGQGLTAVIAAVFLLPAAIGASVVLGVTLGVSDSLESGSSYEECMADPATTLEECLELR